MILKTNIEPDFDLNLFQTSFSKMMYNISVAEKRVVSKEKQFLEVFCISRDNKVLSKCSYCPSHYLCSDLLSISLWRPLVGRTRYRKGNYYQNQKIGKPSYIFMSSSTWLATE